MMADIHHFAKARIEYYSRKRLLWTAAQTVLEHRPSPLGFLRSLSFVLEFRNHPDAFYRYKLSQNWHRRHQYIFDNEIHVILRALNKRFAPVDSADITDKRRFERRCDEAGLPCVKTLAEFDGSSISPADPIRDVFVKYRDKSRGEGAEIWRYKNGRYCNGALSLSFAKLVKQLLDRSKINPVLLQPCLQNHPLISGISGNALSTVRTVTALSAGSPRICAAVYRASTTDAAADNFALGGLAAPIDLDAGKTGIAVVKDVRRLPNRFESHPTGGGSFIDRTIPFWDQIKTLSLKAHQVFGTMPSVGWDIAVTTDGPILLEGNEIWCVDLIQMSHNKPLADGPIPGLLSKFIGATTKRAPYIQ